MFRGVLVKIFGVRAHPKVRNKEKADELVRILSQYLGGTNQYWELRKQLLEWDKATFTPPTSQRGATMMASAREAFGKSIFNSLAGEQFNQYFKTDTSEYELNSGNFLTWWDKFTDFLGQPPPANKKWADNPATSWGKNLNMGGGTRTQSFSGGKTSLK